MTDNDSTAPERRFAPYELCMSGVSLLLIAVPVCDLLRFIRAGKMKCSKKKEAGVIWPDSQGITITNYYIPYD